MPRSNRQHLQRILESKQSGHMYTYVSPFLKTCFEQKTRIVRVFSCIENPVTIQMFKKRLKYSNAYLIDHLCIETCTSFTVTMHSVLVHTLYMYMYLLFSVFMTQIACQLLYCILSVFICFLSFQKWNYRRLSGPSHRNSKQLTK